MLRKQWAAMLQRRKIFLRGEGWKRVTLGELTGICARRVGALEGWTKLGVGVGDISLRFCGVKVCLPPFLFVLGWADKEWVGR